MTTKVCTHCGVEKDISLFSSNVAKVGGIDYFCKDCRNKYNREYYSKHLKENRDRSQKYSETHKNIISIKNHEKYLKDRILILAGNKAYSETDAGKISSKIRSKRYRTNNPEKVKVVAQKYNINNRSKHAEFQREYRKTPIGKFHAVVHKHRRRDAYRKTECSLTLKQWNRIIDMQQNKCADCGRLFNSELKPTRDHIIPVSLGGGLTFGNVQALCASCNSIKHDKVYFTNAITNVLVDSC